MKLILESPNLAKKQFGPQMAALLTLEAKNSNKSNSSGGIKTEKRTVLLTIRFMLQILTKKDQFL